MFLNDCAGLSVNGWLHRGLMTLSEILVVVKLSDKIGYLCVRYMNPCLTLGTYLFRSTNFKQGLLVKKSQLRSEKKIFKTDLGKN